MPGRSANAVRNRFLRCCSGAVDSEPEPSVLNGAVAVAALVGGIQKRPRLAQVEHAGSSPPPNQISMKVALDAMQVAEAAAKHEAESSPPIAYATIS